YVPLLHHRPQHSALFPSTTLFRSIVDRAIHAELLPHEPGVVVGHRSVPIVRVAERCALSEITVLTRARTRNHVPVGVPAGHLSRDRKTTRLNSSPLAEAYPALTLK